MNSCTAYLTGSNSHTAINKTGFSFLTGISQLLPLTNIIRCLFLLLDHRDQLHCTTIDRKTTSSVQTSVFCTSFMYDWITWQVQLVDFSIFSQTTSLSFHKQLHAAQVQQIALHTTEYSKDLNYLSADRWNCFPTCTTKLQHSTFKRYSHLRLGATSCTVVFFKIIQVLWYSLTSIIIVL